MKKLIVFMLIVSGISSVAFSLPPISETTGTYVYTVSITDENNKPLREAFVMIAEDIGFVSTDAGIVILCNQTLFQPADTLVVTKPGYVSQYLFFDEKSDGTATVVLKKDPNAPARDADVKPEKNRSGKKSAKKRK